MTTLDLQVGASIADAHEAQDGSGFGSTFVNLNCRSSPAIDVRRAGGIHLQSVFMHRGATVTSAYLTVVPYDTANDDPNIQIHGEVIDDAPDFAANADIIDRTRTTAFTQWTQTGIGTSPVNSPDISSVIEEIVSHPGWLIGNDLAIFLVGKDDVVSNFRPTAFDFSSADAVKLHIEFDPEPLGQIKDPVLWHAFYLAQFEAVENDPQQVQTLSQSTIDLCLSALILAENRDYWRKDLRELNETQWAKAEDFLTLAIEELTA